MIRRIGFSIKPNSIYILLLVASISVAIAYPVASFAVTLYYLTTAMGFLCLLLSHRVLELNRCQTAIMVFCLLNTLYLLVLYAFSDKTIETSYGRFISTEIITINLLILAVHEKNGITSQVFKKCIMIFGFAGVLSTFIAFDRNVLLMAVSRIVRLNSPIINGNMYAMGLTIIALFIVHSITDNGKWRIPKVAALLVVFYLVTLASSRTALFAFFVGCILYFYFSSPSNKKVLRILQIGLVLLLVLYVMSLFESTSAVLDRIATIWRRDDAVVAASDQSRWGLIRMGIEGWKQKPLFGQGFNSFNQRSSSVIGFSTYAHNNYVELLYNTGAIGLILNYLPKLILVIKLLNKVRIDKTNRFSCALLSSMIVLLMYDMAVVSYYYLSLNYIWIIGASYILRNSSGPYEHVG